MEQEDKCIADEVLSDEQLNRVSGGLIGYDNLDEYKIHGIYRENGNHFIIAESQQTLYVSKGMASALVFYANAHNIVKFKDLKDCRNAMREALKYKASAGADYKKEVELSNR